MPQIRHSIEVNVPLHSVYNQWTQFEDFPRFMDGVSEVRQTDDAHIHWYANRHGKSVEWDSEITEQIPDQLIAWRDVSGPENHGRISFHPVKEDQTRIELTLDLAPDESAQASHEEETRQRIGHDLHRFKQLMEGQGQETGAWRGEIHDAHVRRPDDEKPDPDTLRPGGSKEV